MNLIVSPQRDSTHEWAVILAGGDGLRLRDLSYRLSEVASQNSFARCFNCDGLRTEAESTHRRLRGNRFHARSRRSTLSHRRSWLVESDSLAYLHLNTHGNAESFVTSHSDSIASSARYLPGPSSSILVNANNAPNGRCGALR
jgi:hypothetical protein